jgi:hypothetical protein
MGQTQKKIVVGVIVIAILSLLWVFGSPKRVEAITNKREYPAGTDLDISIQNNLGETICFSSCYPYFLQKSSDGNGDWRDYKYADCKAADVTSACIQNKEFKKFRLPLENADAGTNRLMIPVCLGCQVGQGFRQDQVIYSNSFQVR